MPRIRSVHPDICDDETMSMVSAHAERTFIRLWTHLDDDGRGVDNPKLWKGKLYPLHDDVTASHVDADLNELASHGLIIRYEVDGKRYLCAKPSTWKKYQKPQRPTKSKLPPPTADLAYTSTVLADMSASDPRGLRYGGEGRGEKMDIGAEGGSGGEVPHPAPTTTPVDNFLTEKAAEIACRASLQESETAASDAIPSSAPTPAARTPEQRQQRIMEAARIAAEERLIGRDDVEHPASWVAGTARGIARDHHQELHAWLTKHPTATPLELVEHVIDAHGRMPVKTGGVRVSENGLVVPGSGRVTYFTADDL